MNDVGHDLHDGDQIIQYRKDIYYVGDEYKLINDGVKIINSNCDYYDFSQSFLDVTLKQLYNFEPMVKKIDKKHNKYLEGIEGILWTDHVESSYQLYEYLFPRLFAFSEVAWTSKENRNYQSFENRVYSHLNLLEKMGVKHYTPINKCNYGFIRRKANKAFKK
jgi:N-acetyl-beta-hexosaminidase